MTTLAPVGVELSPLESGRMRALLTLLRGHRRLYVVSVVAIVVRHGCLVLAAATAGLAVGLAATGAAGGVAAASTVAVVAVLVAAAAHWSENHASHVLSFAVLAGLRVGLIGRLARSPRTSFGGRRLGEVVGTVGNDTERLEVFFAHSSLYCFAAAIVSPLTVVAMATYSVPAAVVLALALLAAVAAPMLLRRRAARQGEGQRAAAASLDVEVSETVGALREVLAFDLAQRQQRRVAEAAAEDARARAGIARRAAVEGVLGHAATGLGLIGVAAVLLPDLAAGTRGLPEVIALLGLAAAAPGAVQQLITVTRHWAGTEASAARVAGLLRDTPAVPDGTADLPGDRPLELEYDAVTVTDPAPILHGLTFRAAPGKVTAIAGSSGGGKSTAVALLRPGAHPDGGRVRVGGVDVAAITRAAWQRAVAVVGQDARLVADTVRTNLLLGVPGNDDRGDEDLWVALDATGARHLIERLPGGLDAELDADTLSGGERQRLLLARALVARPRLLVLDEALSHLDEAAEAQLWPHLVGDGDRTVVVVAHRPSTLARADSVVVIDAGHVRAGHPNPEETQEKNT